MKDEMIKTLLIDPGNSDAPPLKSEIDRQVYELYFPDEIKAAICEVLKHLTNLPEIDVNVETQNLASLQTIEKAYKELSDPAHPANIAMKKMQDIPEIRIIEGLDK